MLAKIDGCTVNDSTWAASLLTENQGRSPMDQHTAAVVVSCSFARPVERVPRLLVREFVVSLARRVFSNTENILNTPVVTVTKVSSSTEFPPKFWLVSMIACFPCDGTPVTRCLVVDALLDSIEVGESKVLWVEDVGVVPAEQAIEDGVLPANALHSELLTKS